MIDSLKHIDRLLFLWLNGLHAHVLDIVMFYVSAMYVFAPLFIFWFYGLWKLFDARRLFVIVITMGLIVVLCDQTSNRVKHAVKRYRPTHNLEIKSQVHTVDGYEGGQYGFFSGHAANTFGVATFLVLLFRRKPWLYKSQFIAWALLVSYSRIYLGVHYPSDIFVGMLTGIFWGSVMYALCMWIFRKYTPSNHALE